MTAVRMNISAALRTRWYEYAVRFLFGGAITVAAGLVAKEFGPTAGGLFLAFPAIFPASASLIDKHQKEKKELLGLDGRTRGRLAASLDARGATLGSLGLIVFALVVWKLLVWISPWAVIVGATLTWLMVSILLWNVCRTIRAKR